MSRGTHLVEVREGALEHTTLKTVRSDLGARGAGDKGLANLLHGEHRGSLDVVPVLLKEGVETVEERSTGGRKERERSVTGKNKNNGRDALDVSSSPLNVFYSPNEPSLLRREKAGRLATKAGGAADARGHQGAADAEDIIRRCFCR